MQKQLWKTLLLLFAAITAHAQLTIKVTSIPVNTPAGASIYIAGSFNNWNPSDATKILTAVGSGQYSIVLNPPNGTVEYKFTRNGWPTVEGNATGGEQPNHSITYNGQPKTVEVAILSWKDLAGGSNPGSTAAANVQVLDNAFYIPQLNRTRRILLYLPPDYQTTTKKYPVLYMHDGQNLFDAATSFSGEWKVDESLNALFQQGDYGCIVVGIDNGGQFRLDEYSPWVNADYGGGQGAAYVDFIVNTLKPYIDDHFRTLSGRQTTGIMGSSMGGLISMYAFSEHQDIFAKAGILSPAFWFAGSSPATHVAAHPKEGASRVYFVCGGDEPQYVEDDMQSVANAMTTAGFTTDEKFFTVPSDGQHSEWFWAREFPDAYEWLFAGSVSATGAPVAQKDLQVYPNPANDWVRVADATSNKDLVFQILGIDGKIWRDTIVHGADPVFTGDLPAGFYIVKARAGRGKWRSGRLVKW